ASQLSNAEWLPSMPGSDPQKQGLLNCVSCHSLERVVRSTHDAAEFAQLIKRMSGYANQSMPVHLQRRVAQRALEERGDQLQKSQQKTAEFLSTINLSESEGWDYPLKTFPRPSGRGPHVIITGDDDVGAAAA